MLSDVNPISLSLALFVLWFNFRAFGLSLRFSDLVLVPQPIEEEAKPEAQAAADRIEEEAEEVEAEEAPKLSAQEKEILIKIEKAQAEGKRQIIIGEEVVKIY